MSHDDPLFKSLNDAYQDAKGRTPLSVQQKNAFKRQSKKKHIERQVHSPYFMNWAVTASILCVCVFLLLVNNESDNQYKLNPLVQSESFEVHYIDLEGPLNNPVREKRTKTFEEAKKDFEQSQFFLGKVTHRTKSEIWLTDCNNTIQIELKETLLSSFNINPTSLNLGEVLTMNKSPAGEVLNINPTSGPVYACP